MKNRRQLSCGVFDHIYAQRFARTEEYLVADKIELPVSRSLRFSRQKADGFIKFVSSKAVFFIA